MIKSIIKPVKDRDGFSLVNEHIAQITGYRYVPKPRHYIHRETNREYFYLAAGLGWPRDPKEKPGFAVIVAVDKTTDEKPCMTALEEAESPTIDGLLRECVRLQNRYGRKECSDLFRIWWGDQERADTSVSLFNSQVEPTENHNKIYVAAPYDFEKDNALERYISQISSSLTADPKTGRKRLSLGGCIKLRNYLQNTPSDAAIKGTVKDYPAIAGLGGVLHTLMMLIPWTEFLQPTKTIPTVYDPLQEDYDQDWWENESDDDQEYDDGELVRTC